MKIVIYPPIKEFKQTAYTIQIIDGNRIDERTVPEYRIDKYISNITRVVCSAGNVANFKIREV